MLIEVLITGACVCIYTASKSRDDHCQVPDAIQLDVRRSNSPQRLDTKSSPSVTSSPSLSSSSSSPQRRAAARDSPQQSPTGSDVTDQPPRVGTMTSPQLARDERGAVTVSVEETRQSTGAGPLIRRRAVDLSDLRSCALVQTQMKTRKASASWRYGNDVFLF